MKTATLLLFATAVLAGESGESPRAAGRNVYLKDDALGWQRVVRARDGNIVARDPADPPAALGLPPVVDGGLFQPYVATSVGSWPEAVAVGDLNGDLRNDVALVTSFYFDPVNDYCLFVFLQDSNGGLLPPVRYPIGQEPASVDIGDLNDDGRADVLVGRKDNGFSVLYQDAAGGLGAPVTYPTTQGLKIRIGDFDGDARDDVAGINWSPNLDVFLQQPGGGFTLAQSIVGTHAGYDDLDVGDPNGDGRDDVFVMSGQLYASPNVSWYRQRVGGLLYPAGILDLGGNELTHGVAVGDVTGDLVSDVVVSYGGNSPSSHLAVWRRSGKTFLPATILTSYDIPEPVEVRDVTGDGRLDALTAHGGWLRLGVYTQQVNGTLGPEQLYPIPYASHYNPHGLAVGDFTGDGAADVAIADYNYGLVVLRHLPNTSPPGPAPSVQPFPASQRVRLTWFRGALAARYRILRSETGQPEVVVGETTAARFVDRGLTAGTEYTYRVQSVNPFGVALSDPVTVIPRD